MKSLKAEFTLIISTLILIVVGVNSLLFLYQKGRELHGDIFVNSFRFAELTYDSLVRSFTETQDQDNFLGFLPRVTDISSRNSDIKDILIVDKSGHVEYQRSTDLNGFYQGISRRIPEEWLPMVASANPSVFEATSKRPVYLHTVTELNPKTSLQEKKIIYEDDRGKETRPIIDLDEISIVVYPHEDAKHVVIYLVTYSVLYQRIFDTVVTTGVATLLFIVVGGVLAFIFSGWIARPIKTLSAFALEISRGGFGKTIDLKRGDEVGLLAQSFNTMSEKLSDATAEIVSSEKLKQEVDLASQIQRELIPKVLPLSETLELTAGLIPAMLVGGDIYDVLKRPDGSVLLYIGDVTGHGVSAGVLAAMVNTVMYSEGLNDDLDLLHIANKLNTIFYHKTQKNMFVTMIIGLWDVHKKTLSYVMCGHNPLVFFSSKDQTCEIAKKGGIALGILPDISKVLKVEKKSFSSCDSFVFYTDGIPEAKNAEGSFFGMQRFLDVITRPESTNTPKRTTQQMQDEIIESVLAWVGEAEHTDDITILIGRVLAC